jgi:hypothetical protein
MNGISAFMKKDGGASFFQVRVCVGKEAPMMKQRAALTRCQIYWYLDLDFPVS